MKTIILSLVLFFPLVCLYSQKRIYPTISLSETSSVGGSYNIYKAEEQMLIFSKNPKHFPSGRSFTTTHLSIGTYFNTHKIDWKIALENELLLQVNEKDSKLLNYLLGLNFEVRILNKSIVRPIFATTITTEVATNYKNRFLQNQYYDPISPSFAESSNSSNMYLGTPLVIHSLLGINLNVSKRITLNFLIGYGCRIIKIRKRVLVFEKNNFVYHYNNIVLPFNMIDFQFGIVYNFLTFKKHPQTTTP